VWDLQVRPESKRGFLMKKRDISQEITTSRLWLRPFRTGDFEVYTTIMAEPEVGKWFPKGEGFSRKETEKSFHSIQDHWVKYHFGIWAIVHKRKKRLMDRCGLNLIDEISEVEIDFLLAHQFWGNGFATEAATAVLKYGFTLLQLDRIIALAKIDNIASRHVLEKIGMKYSNDNHYWGILCAKYEITKATYAHKH
jgi:ribosomal-protein-alanine N-acetyltransferase